MRYLKEDNEYFERIVKAEQALEELGIKVFTYNQLFISIDGLEHHYEIADGQFPRMTDEPLTRSA